MATKLLRQIVIKLFGPNYLVNGSVRYFFWPRGSVKEREREKETKGAVKRKSSGTAAVGYFNTKCRRICINSFRITRYKSFSGDSYTVHKLQAGSRHLRHDHHT